MGKRAAIRRRIRRGAFGSDEGYARSPYGTGLTVPGGGRTRGRRRRAIRRRLGPLGIAGIGVAVLVLGAVAVTSWPGTSAEADPKESQAQGERDGQGVTAQEQGETEVAPQPGEPDPSGAAGTAAGAGASASPSPSKTPAVPESGPGTFSTARAQGDPVGSGPLRRYRVQVEDGIEISADDAAAEIEKILAHPRGWAAHGRGTFQLVSAESDADAPADFVIRIATPATADKLCLAQGLDTHGELNCETVDGVVVNLRRWVQGSPQFDGPPADYRHLIINHEVGHEIGLSQHLGCGGPGKLAPVMMQQIKGLDGCRSNAWPYDEKGAYVDGPPA
ncbi:DUF3152 domain-containing protein [Streptomyces sp. NPDC093085]|uniref:DUF3152 domain-containing protein n=1 Tax=Streptomyces sp. NPDC093085 TaxID=3155068 RepID=UPI00341383AA